MLRLFVGLGAQNPGGDGGPGRVQIALGLEPLSVDLRDLGTLGVDEVGERVGETELTGPDRALRR